MTNIEQMEKESEDAIADRGLQNKLEQDAIAKANAAKQPVKLKPPKGRYNLDSMN